MLKNILRKFTSASPEAQTEQPAAQDNLALQAANQQLHLELEQAQAQIRRLQETLARQQESASAGQTAAVQARLGALLAELARPAAQFLLQIHLAGQGKTLQAQDVLGVARHFVNILNGAGVEVSEQINDPVVFDPDQHQALAGGLAGGQAGLTPGQMAVVRTPGLVLRAAAPGGLDQRLVKAGVAPQEVQ